MWERFSYYGMRAFLILYMVAPRGAGRPRLRGPGRRVDLRHLHRQRLGRRDPRRRRRGSLARPVSQRARRRHHHRARPLHAGVQGAPLLLHRPRPDRRRHRPAEAERQHARRLALSRRATRAATPDSRSSTWGSTSARSSVRSSPGTWRSASTGISASRRRASAWRLAWRSTCSARKRLTASGRTPRSAAGPTSAADGRHRAGSPPAASRAVASRARRMEADRRDRHLLPLRGAVLGRLRAGRLDPQPVRRPLHAARALRLRVPVVLVPVGAADLRDLFAPVFAWLWMRLGAARAVGARRSSRSASSSWRSRSWCSCRPARWRRAARACGSARCGCRGLLPSQSSASSASARSA